MENAVIHFLGLAAAIPADLLNAVVKLVDMAVRVIGIDVPVAARHIAPDPLNADALFLKEPGAVDHFRQSAGLPGNLVDGDFPFAAAAAAGRHESGHNRAGKEDKGVVVAAVGKEIAAPVLNMGQLRLQPGDSLEIQRIRLPEPQQIPVKVDGFGHVVGIKPEVAQPPNLKGAVQQHPADIVLFGLGSGH